MELGQNILIIKELSSLHNRFTTWAPIGVDVSVHSHLISPLRIIINTEITLQIKILIYNN